MTFNNDVLEWRPGVGHVPLLTTVTERGGNAVGIIQTTTVLNTQRQRTNDQSEERVVKS